jgi:hypothetical protein
VTFHANWNSKSSLSRPSRSLSRPELISDSVSVTEPGVSVLYEILALPVGNFKI